MTGLARRTLTLLGREFKVLWKWRPNVYSLLVSPLSYLLIFSISMTATIGHIKYESADVPYFTFLLPGIVAMQAFAHFAVGITDSSNERRWGLLKSYYLNAVRPLDYLCAKVLKNVFILVFQTAIMLACAGALGMTNISVTSSLALIWAAVVSSAFWTSIGVMLGSHVSREDMRASFTTLLTLPITLTASVFYDIDRAPVALRAVGLLNPLNYQTRLMRNSLIGLRVDRSLAPMMIALTAVALFLGWFSLARVSLDER